MKARYGVLLAVMLTLIFAGAVFADSASADEYTVTVVVQPANITAEHDEYTTEGGACNVKLVCDPGYYLAAGSTVTYKLGDASPVNLPIVLRQTEVTINLTEITEDMTLTVSSATVSNVYNVHVDIGTGQKCYSEGGSDFPVTYGGSQAVTIKPSPGYKFTIGGKVIYKQGTAVGLEHTIGELEANGFTLNVENVTDDVTLEITLAPTEQIEYSVTLSKAAGVMCEVPTIDPATPSPIHYGDNVTIRITAIAGYSFAGTTANVRVTGSSTTESDYDLTITGNYATFVIENITENLSVRVLEVEMVIATYTVTVRDNTGSGISSEMTSYTAEHGDELRIGISAADRYYFLKGTQITMTQGMGEIIYKVETDAHTGTFITNPVISDVEITIDAIDTVPVRFYATSNDDSYGSYYLGSVGDLTTPTDVGRGTLYLTDDADGWFRMSAPVTVEEEGTPKVKYFTTRLIQHDGIASDYDTVIEFNSKSSLVHVVSGVITEIRAEIGAAVTFVNQFKDPNSVVFDEYINDSSSVMTFTGSNTAGWTYSIPSTEYKAFSVMAGTGFSVLHIMKNVPTAFSAKSNKDGGYLYLCPSSDSSSTTITVTGYAVIYQNSTLTSISDKMVRFTGTFENGDTFTLVEKDGLFESVTIDAGKSFQSNGTTYINSSTSASTFYFSSGDVSTGYVIGIRDASDGVTRYYSSMNAITGGTSVLQDGDIVYLTQHVNDTTTGIQLYAGTVVTSYGASNSVTVLYGNAFFKVSSGVITWIIVPENATLIDGSGKNVGVVKKGASNVEVEMDPTGQNIVGVNIGASYEVYVTLNYAGTITIGGITVINKLRDYEEIPNNISVDVYNTEDDIVVKPAVSGGFTVLKSGSTWTVYNADDAIANSVSGDNIQIFGDADTSGSRDYWMTRATFVDADWDKFLRVLPQGVSVNGEAITADGQRYIHITDGELYVVKNYGYRHNFDRNNSRWIWYDYNKLLYYGGSSKTANFRIYSNTFNTEIPGDTRSFVYRNDSDAIAWMRSNVSPTLETIETHNGMFESYMRELQAYNLKSVMMHDTTTLYYYRLSETTIEYLYFDGTLMETSTVRACPNLKEVVLPNVTEILSCDFYGDANLEKVTCPKVEFIGSEAFRECSSLKSIDGYDVASEPNKFTIDSTAFYKCYALEYVNMPKVTTVNSTAFYMCTSLKYVNLPEVLTIGIESFSKCNNLTDLNIPKVQSIGRYGFFECWNLGDLYLPEVTTIGQAVFSGSSSGGGEGKVFSTYGIAARTVYMPKVTELGEYAFANCPNLETVICPALYKVYAYAFFNCTSLKSFDAPNLERTNDKDGYWNDLGYTFYNCTSLVTFNAPKAKTIGTFFFGKCANLRDMNVDGVEDILDNAFKGCVCLENLYLPSVTLISTRAFVGSTPGSGTTAYGVDACTSLKSVYMPNVITIKNCAFLGCEKLESVVMDSVDEIWEYAFYKCTALKSVYAPVMSKDLGQYTFTFDSKIESVDMRNAKSIGTYSFYYCSSIKSVNINGAEHVYSHAFEECRAMETLKISKCKDVAEYGFNNCIKLQELTAEKMETLGSYAFMNNAELTKADLETLQSAGYCSFQNCTKLATLNIPAIRMLNEYCFKNTGIKTLSFGNDDALYTMDTAIVILRNAFDHCTSLTDIVIGTSEKVYIDTYYQNAIRQEVFKDCTLLKNVTIGKITRLSTNMFQGCEKLENCTVREVGTIDSYAFQSVGALVLTVGPVTGNIGEYVIGSSDTKKVIIGDVAGYITANAFRGTAKLSTVVLGNVGEIRNNAFSHNSDLVSFKSGTISIMGANVFEECKKLESVYTEGIGLINKSVFYNCQNLKYVNVEESDENLGLVDLRNSPTADNCTTCFYNCNNITKVILSPSTTIIPESMFNHCDALAEVKGTNVVRVDQYAFTMCVALKIIDVNRSTDTHVTVCMYDNHAIWHTTHTVYIGGYQVTSPNDSGKNKTLTLTNCTVNPYHTNGYSRNSVNDSQTSTSVFDKGFKYIKIYDDVTLIKESYYGSSALTNLEISGENISIGNLCFASGKLEEIRITKDVEFNSTEVFRSNENLANIYGGQHILSIGNGVFRYNYNLLNIYDDSYNPEGSNNKVASMPNLRSISDDGLNLVINWSDYPYRVNYTDYGGKIVELYAPKLESLGTAAVMSNGLTKVTAGDVKEMYTMSFGRMSNSGSMYYGCPNLHTFICSTYEDTIGTSASVKKLSTDMFIPNVTRSTTVYIYNIGITGSQVIGTEFKGDSNLQTLILGNITVSADEVFASTPNLYAVTFVGNAKMGTGAFKDCTSLESILMINCSPEFGVDTFKNCENLYSFEADENCHPTVSSDMFVGCSSLETFNVEGLTALPDRLFSGCSSLKKINSTIDGYAILNKVTSIGDSPFSGIVIKHMELDGMKTVNDTMFTGLSSVEYLSLNGATTIADNSFSDLDNLQELYIDSMGTVSKKKVNNEFNNNTVLRIVSIRSITTTQMNTFMGCTALETVYLRDDPIPSGTTVVGTITIGENSFYGCASLKTINLDWVDKIEANAFRDSGITEVSLPLVTGIGEYAFYNCSEMKKVVIGGCLSYGDYCFSCEYDPVNNPSGKRSGLEEMILSADGAMIGRYMFSNCTNFVKIYKSGVCNEGEAHLDSVGSIEEGAFKGCTGFKTVFLPTNLESIGDYSFDGCSNLEKVNTAEGVDLTIGNYSFRNCGSLYDLKFGTVVEIGNNTFEGCYNIGTLTMAKLKTMGTNSFKGCYGLTTVTMNSLEKVTNGAFSGCNSLLKVNMKGLKIIGNNAFDGCSSLTTFGGDQKVLNLPNVTTIGDYAFQGCSAFESIKFGVYLTSIGSYAFKDVLFGPTTKPSSQLIFPNSLTYIGDGAFSSVSGNGSYDTISIPNSVTNIGKEAFSARSKLSIYFNGNVDQNAATSTKMGNKAFYAAGKITVYLWKECTTLDLSNYIKGSSTITYTGEDHAQVWMFSNDGVICSYRDAVLLNDGYLILPYGEESMSAIGKKPVPLYFGMASGSSGSATLVLLNERGNQDSIAKSGDYFRPVVTYTPTDEIKLYYLGCMNATDAGGSILIDANFAEGITKEDVPNWNFDTKQYWYRDEVILPTFGGTLYTKDTVYGKDAKLKPDVPGEPQQRAVYYPGADSITLGYIESMLLVTVQKFPTTVYWVDAQGTITTTAYFGDTVDELPVARDKTAYHFLWWSTVEGSTEEADKVIPGVTTINTVETFFYAIYSPNTYYVKIYCSSPIDISGYVIDPNTGYDYFKMAGAFAFYMNGTTGEVYYKDKDHTTYTLMFNAATWQEGYRFADFVYKGIQVEGISEPETYNPDLGDEITYTIEMDMIERTYSVNLKFLDANNNQPLAHNEYVVIGNFVGTKQSYTVDTSDMTVKNILYSDLKANVIVPIPLYEDDVDRYTYNNTAKNETYGNTNLAKDSDQNLYINYESFKLTGGAKTTSITIAYYFDKGMYNIKYVYDDDAGTIYNNPATVQVGTKVSITNADGKVKTGYQFDKWVVLNKEGEIPEKEEDRIYFYPGDKMLIDDSITVNADNTNTIVLKGLWTPKTVKITFDLGSYPGTEAPIYKKVDETFPLPDGSNYNMSGWVMTGWYFVKGGDVYTTLTLTPNIYGAYIQEGEVLPMHANWVVKTYTFQVKHYDPDDPDTKDCPSESRYTNTLQYSYNKAPIELWKADVIDSSQQFKTLKGWQVKYTYTEGGTEYTMSQDISLGAYEISEEEWQKLAAIAKKQGSDTLMCYQLWDEKTFNLYFDTDGGGALDVNTKGPLKIGDGFNVFSGDKLSKRGYTFSGWYCGTDTITVYVPSLDESTYLYTLDANMASMAVEQTITFTAVWTQSSYTLDYDLDGGVPSGVIPRTAYYETQVEIDYPTKSGYTFSGWSATGITTSAQYKNGDKWSTWDGTAVLSKSFCYLSWDDGSTVVMTAVWQQTTYNINWNNLNGGSGTPSGGTTSAAIGDKFTLATLLNADKIGYTFQGWSYDNVNIYPNSSGKFNEELAAAADVNNTVLMYAIWSPITYELWYNYNGNTQQQYVKITARYDEVINVEHLDRTGYSFDGWTSTDASTTTSRYSTTGEGENWFNWSNPNYPANASFFKNLAYTQDAIVHMVATYTAVIYHVQYDANGGTGEVPTDVATYKVGDKFTLASFETLVGTNGDKSIVGWNTDRNATTAISVTVFNESIALAADSSNTVTFYAVWVENGCLIKVDLGDATPSYIPSGWKQQQDTGYYVKQVEYGTPVKEAMADWDNVTISKEGYVFTSWSYSASTAISDVMVTCNFEKVENNLLYIFLGIFLLIVVAIIIISRIER